MSDESVLKRLQELEDRARIIDIVCRFAVSIDRRRWADLANCFADEIEINTIRTGRWVRTERAEVIDVLRRAFETYTATQHISANHQITINEDAAVALSTLNATHHLVGAPGGDFHQQVGYYEYHLVREPEQGWQITKVEQLVHWQRGNQEIFDRTLA